MASFSHSTHAHVSNPDKALDAEVLAPRIGQPFGGSVVVAIEPVQAPGRSRAAATARLIVTGDENPLRNAISRAGRPG